jgi:hypothetical protein
MPCERDAMRQIALLLHGTGLSAFLVILFGVAMVACLIGIPFGRYRAVRRC